MTTPSLRYVILPLELALLLRDVCDDDQVAAQVQECIDDLKQSEKILVGYSLNPNEEFGPQ